MKVFRWSIELGSGSTGKHIKRNVLLKRAVLERLEHRELLSTYTVTSVADDGSAGTLRWALTQADEHFESSTINFASNVTGTITLAQGQLDISNLQPVYIFGPGANVLSINGNGATRVFAVLSGETAQIVGLTIKGGSADSSSGGYGGGIFNNGGNLTLDSCTISGDSAFVGGGGIENDGDLILSNSTLYGDSAPYGGGIKSSSSLTMINSTLYGNSANNGGGLYSTTANTVTITNCTIAGNSASSGGGGIYNSGNLIYNNTIVSGNTLTGVSTPSDISSTNNEVNGDAVIVGTNVNPHLGPLQNNGGPTKTMALLPGSRAIDGGISPWRWTPTANGWSRTNAVLRASCRAWWISERSNLNRPLQDSVLMERPMTS